MINESTEQPLSPRCYKTNRLPKRSSLNTPPAIFFQSAPGNGMPLVSPRPSLPDLKEIRTLWFKSGAIMTLVL